MKMKKVKFLRSNGYELPSKKGGQTYPYVFNCCGAQYWRKWRKEDPRIHNQNGIYIIHGEYGQETEAIDNFGRVRKNVHVNTRLGTLTVNLILGKQ